MMVFACHRGGALHKNNSRSENKFEVSYVDCQYIHAQDRLPYNLDYFTAKVIDAQDSDSESEYGKDLGSSATYYSDYGKSNGDSYAFDDLGFLLIGNPNLCSDEGTYTFNIDISIDTVFQEYWIGLGACANFDKVTDAFYDMLKNLHMPRHTQIN